jgi:hypothetical protein
MALARIMREYVMNEMQRRGNFFLHASSFVTASGPVIVTGPKKAGKTSLVMFACSAGDGVYLSNDRVLLQLVDGDFVLRSVPVIITVREKTFEFFPRLKKRILDEEMNFRARRGERLRDVSPDTVIGSDGEYDLSQEQFCDLLGSAHALEAHKPIVVIPQITGRPGTFTIRAIDEKEAASFLRHSLFGGLYWATSTPVFNLRCDRGPNHSGMEENLRKFVADTPFLLCEVGTDLYLREPNARRWIDAIFESAGRPEG